MQIQENKPCLVPAGQGFSVKYRDKFLYSRYDPKKSVLRAVEGLAILPDTLLLCVSPLLCHGLPELLQKLPENCLVLGIEADENLFELTMSEFSKIGLNIADADEKFRLLSPEETRRLPSSLDKNFSGEYKRIQRIDFSAGAALNREFYSEIFEVSQNVVNQFWKNRLTLVRFGRKYSSNLFRNLKILSIARNFDSVKKAAKPILVVGAGESAVKTLLEVKKRRNDFFIISVDAGLATFKVLGIKADAAVCEECQSVIACAFRGVKDAYENLFISLSANPSVAAISPARDVFYASLYSNADFLKNLVRKKIIRLPFEPLGSVGLSAVQVALKLRKNDNVPIYVTGLDFSYSAGNTHVKSSFHENERRKKSTRISGLDSFAESFGISSIKKTGKDGRTVFTGHALEGYRNLFSDRFSAEKNIFDVAESGLPLGVEALDFSKLAHSENFFAQNFERAEIGAEEKTLFKNAMQEGTLQEDLMQESAEQKFKSEQDLELSKKICDFLAEEKNALLELKSILTGKTECTEAERGKRIMEIIKPREYLYLHFPDGYRANLSLGFLKRVRAEVDYFLKIISD